MTEKNWYGSPEKKVACGGKKFKNLSGFKEI
jgi:hypothetical protein